MRYSRSVRATTSEVPSARFPSTEHARKVLGNVLDPEIPVLSIVDLGIVRYVRWISTEHGSGKLHVGLTPTYSGCPATDVIRQSVRFALLEAGYDDIELEEVLSPPWSSEWLSDAGRRKLEQFGIAPPRRLHHGGGRRIGPDPVSCPRCGSAATQRVS